MLLPLLLTLLPTPAVAGAPVPVLVSGFQAEDAGSVPAALRLPELLTQVLETEPGVELHRIERIPAVGGQPATLYMEACPAGQVVGCSFVLGEAAGCAFALTGTVKQAPDSGESLVHLQILDIAGYQDALSIDLDFDPTREAVFAAEIPAMLRDVVEGWVGQPVDIRRAAPAPEPKDEVDREAAAQDLSDLEGELGEVSGDRTGGDLSTAPHREERVRLSHAALLAQYEGKRAPWEEMDLSSRQYLAWWNSGWDYPSWSRRFDGRKHRFLLRVQGGWGLNPSHELYWGRTAFDEQAVAQDSYASQEVQAGGGLLLGVGLGFGISPALEIEAGIERVQGQYEVNVRQQEVDGSLTDRRVEAFPQGLPHAWVGLRLVPMPTARLRPIGGLGLGWWAGKDVADHAEIPLSTLPEFAAPQVFSARMLVGAELRLAERLDLCLQVPLHLLLAGTAPQIYDEDRGVLTEEHQPGAGARVAGGAQIAVQLRL